MKTFQVEIKDPRAVKILSDLADLGIIAIKENKKEEGFLSMVNKIRNEAENNIPSTEDIRKEVQLVMQSILYNNKVLKSNGL